MLRRFNIGKEIAVGSYVPHSAAFRFINRQKPQESKPGFQLIYEKVAGFEHL